MNIYQVYVDESKQNIVQDGTGSGFFKVFLFFDLIRFFRIQIWHSNWRQNTWEAMANDTT